MRTDSKIVRDKIKALIIKNYNEEYFSYNGEPATDYHGICLDLYGAFKSEILDHDARFKSGLHNEQDAFEYWLSGLCSAFDICTDIYLKSAVDMLGDILEQDEKTRAKYEETDAEKMLCYLFYREIKREVTR